MTPDTKLSTGLTPREAARRYARPYPGRDINTLLTDSFACGQLSVYTDQGRGMAQETLRQWHAHKPSTPSPEVQRLVEAVRAILANNWAAVSTNGVPTVWGTTGEDRAAAVDALAAYDAVHEKIE